MATIKQQTKKNGKKSFHVRIRLKSAKGEILTECKIFRNITLAKNYIQSTEAAIKDGRYCINPESKRRTFGDLVDRYIRDVLPQKPKSLRKQTAQLLWWKGQMGHLPLAAVTAPMIAEQRDRLKNGTLPNGQRRSNATVVRYLAVLSHVFTIAVREWQWLEDSPMRGGRVTKPKEDKGRARFLSPDDRDKLLEACKSSSDLYSISRDPSCFIYRYAQRGNPYS